MNSTDFGNEKDVNEYIRVGLLYANRTIDTPIDTFVYSPRFMRWERKILASPFKNTGKKSYTTTRRVFNVAAAVFITVAVLFGILMAASPTVRGAVVRWFRELFITHDTYQFTQTTNEQSLGRWRPSYLPDGYIETFHVDLATQIVVNFENDTGDRITLNYMFINEGFVINIDNEDVDIKEMRIGIHSAYEYRAHDNFKRNSIVWMDEDAGVAFTLSSFEPCEILISIAESIRLSE